MEKNTKTRGTVTTQANTELCQKLSYADTATTSVPRLLAYIDYVSKNGGKIDLSKITHEELNTLIQWHDRGLIDYSDDTIKLSHAFYQMMCQILWEAYVAH